VKKHFLHLLCCLILFVSIASCGVHKQIVDNTIAGYSRMEYCMDKVLGQTQLDSMIVVDRLSSLDKWVPSKFGSKTQYIFIKSLDNDELIYTVTTTRVDTLYKCTKRITKTIDE
jgi:hypothetical protein